MATQPWGVFWDPAGNVQSGLSVLIKNRDGTNATHYSARTAGTSTTGSITTDVNGRLTRYIDPGEYTLTVNAVTYDIDAVSGSLRTTLAYNVKEAPYAALGDNSNDDTAEIQAAIDACSAAGGGEVVIPAGTYRVSSALSIPNFVCVRGHGQSTIIRCTGNHYAFNLNPANRVRISHLQIDALTTQSSGGGFDFTNYGNNCWLSDIFFGSNLHTSLNIAPAVQGGHIIIERIRWNGVTGCTNGIVYGSGSVIVTDCYISHAIGTVGTPADMGTWIKLRKGGADTFHMADCLFYGGSKGIEIGVEGSTGDSTNHKFSSVVFDNMDVQGIDIDSCRIVDFVNCSVQGCGTTTLPGVDIGAAAQAVSWTGGHACENEMDGIKIRAGAVETMIVGVKLLNNNRTNQTFGAGLTVDANTSNWSMIGCVSGNNLSGATANQKYGLVVGGGNSASYVTANNRFVGNVTAAYLFGTMTGAGGLLVDNVPEVIGVIASATATTLPPGKQVIVSGTTTITSITAAYVGREVTIKFSGILTLTDGSNLLLAGNFVTSADDTITLFCDGTNWIEKSRSVN